MQQPQNFLSTQIDNSNNTSVYMNKQLSILYIVQIFQGEYHRGML